MNENEIVIKHAIMFCITVTLLLTSLSFLKVFQDFPNVRYFSLFYSSFLDPVMKHLFTRYFVGKSDSYV